MSKVVNIPERWWRCECLYVARADESCAEYARICVSRMIFVADGMCVRRYGDEVEWSALLYLDTTRIIRLGVHTRYPYPHTVPDVPRLTIMCKQCLMQCLMQFCAQDRSVLCTRVLYSQAERHWLEMLHRRKLVPVTRCFTPLSDTPAVIVMY